MSKGKENPVIRNTEQLKGEERKESRQTISSIVRNKKINSSSYGSPNSNKVLVALHTYFTSFNPHETQQGKYCY